MALDIEVALIGDPCVPIQPGVLDQRFYDMPYGERRRVSLQAELDETLATVLERAAEEMGLEIASDVWSGPKFDASFQKIAFFKPEDAQGFAERAQVRMHLNDLTLVDDSGRAVIGVNNLRAVRYSDLIEASRAGVIEGDPLRPYLILDDGWGDWPGIDLVTLGQGLDLLWEVAKVTAVVTGAATGLAKAWNWVLQRVERGRGALATNSIWAQRGYRPDQIAALASVRSWTTDELARLLGCTDEAAEGILWILGFAEENGLWRRRADTGAEFLSDLLHALAWAVHEGGDWEERLRGWLVRYLETGIRPPFDMLSSYSPDDAEAELFEVSFETSLGERVDAAVDAARRFIARIRRHE